MSDEIERDPILGNPVYPKMVYPAGHSVINSDAIKGKIVNNKDEEKAFYEEHGKPEAKPTAKSGW